MLDGSYYVTLRSPIGPKQGTLTLRQRGNTLRGRFVILGKVNAIYRGVADDSRFTIFGQWQTAVGPTEYILKGVVEEGRLTATAYTSKGNMAMIGQRRQVGSRPSRHKEVRR